MKTISLSLILILLTTGIVLANPFKFPEKIDGFPDWRRRTGVKNYLDETLHEYLEGNAARYREYRARELTVTEFEVLPAKDRILRIEIFEMSTALEAFGVLSIERPPDTSPQEIENLFYETDKALIGYRDRYYIRIHKSPPGTCREEARSLAKAVVKDLEGSRRLPFQLDIFPPEGLIRESIKYVPVNLLGYEFLKHGFIADYENHARLFFILGGDYTEADTVWAHYRTFIASRPVKTRTVREKLWTLMIVPDTFYQAVYFFHHQNLVWGILQTPSDDWARTTAEQLLSRANAYLVRPHEKPAP